jgi:hypothetical protein
MKLVRESLLLDAYPVVLLGESSRPPRLSREPQQLGDICSDDDVHMADAAETTPFSEMIVYYYHPLSNTHGIPVIVKSTKDPLFCRRSTLGFVRSEKSSLESPSPMHLSLLLKMISQVRMATATLNFAGV